MSPALSLIVLGVILIAELPDKTMFATLVLSTRFAARWVFLGAAAAFLTHVVIAVAAGSLLRLVPHRALELIVAGLFLIGAAYMLHESRSREEGEEEAAEAAPSRSPWAVAAASYGVIFIGEWGDITQIATANLAAKYGDPLSVGIGATLGLWGAALLAITAGQRLLRYVSITLMHRVGAAIFLGFSAYTLAQALT
jgi:putative Ca2+/H+ antiporter (TMEM165/GDT1 family)